MSKQVIKTSLGLKIIFFLIFCHFLLLSHSSSSALYLSSISSFSFSPLPSFSSAFKGRNPWPHKERNNQAECGKGPRLRQKPGTLAWLLQLMFNLSKLHNQSVRGTIKHGSLCIWAVHTGIKAIWIITWKNFSNRS